MIEDTSGNFYGTTTAGGVGCEAFLGGCGTVFELSPAGTETVLYRFTGGADGAEPAAGVIRDAAGNLYGTTEFGGGSTLCQFGCGTVFELSPSGTETVLHSFTGGADGEWPLAGVIRDSAGNLYGTAGVVFELSPTGAETVLYTFTGGADGGSPLGGLVRDASGNLYGTTWGGGKLGYGVIFEVSAAGVETVLYTFTGNGIGDAPRAGLITDPSGNFYGTASDAGGRNGLGGGTVFEFTPPATARVPHLFGNIDLAVRGTNPEGGMIRDAAGNFYGTTNAGGSGSLGVVFELTFSGRYGVLHNFTGADGDGPYGGVIRDASGNLYGTTVFGGAYNSGVVFKLSRQ